VPTGSCWGRCGGIGAVQRLAIRDATFANGWPVAGSPLGETAVTIKNVYSNLCADVWFASTEDRAAVNSGSCNAGTNQRWQATASGNNYEFRATHSSQCLEVHGTVTTAGEPVTQWPCNAGTHQKWERIPTFGGYSMLRNVATGMCLEVYGKTTTNGAALNQWPCNSGPNQQWMLD